MRNDDGSALVEAAIVLPVMLTVIIGGLDLGLGMVAATRPAERRTCWISYQYFSQTTTTCSEIGTLIKHERPEVELERRCD
jgi:hypothetical protein